MVLSSLDKAIEITVMIWQQPQVLVLHIQFSFSFFLCFPNSTFSP